MRRRRRPSGPSQDRLEADADFEEFVDAFLGPVPTAPVEAWRPWHSPDVSHS